MITPDEEVEHFRQVLRVAERFNHFANVEIAESTIDVLTRMTLPYRTEGSAHSILELYQHEPTASVFVAVDALDERRIPKQ